MNSLHFVPDRQSFATPPLHHADADTNAVASFLHHHSIMLGCRSPLPFHSVYPHHCDIILVWSLLSYVRVAKYSSKIHVRRVSM